MGATGIIHGVMTNSDTSPAVLSCDIVIAVVSSVTVFIVSSLLFPVTGFVCGYYFGQKQKLSPPAPKETLSKITHPQSILLCEDTQPSMDSDLQLKENVAYGSSVCTHQPETTTS